MVPHSGVPEESQFKSRISHLRSIMQSSGSSNPGTASHDPRRRLTSVGEGSSAPDVHLAAARRRMSVQGHRIEGGEFNHLNKLLNREYRHRSNSLTPDNDHSTAQEPQKPPEEKNEQRTQKHSTQTVPIYNSPAKKVLEWKVLKTMCNQPKRSGSNSQREVDEQEEIKKSREKVNCWLNECADEDLSVSSLDDEYCNMTGGEPLSPMSSDPANDKLAQDMGDADLTLLRYVEQLQKRFTNLEKEMERVLVDHEQIQKKWRIDRDKCERARHENMELNERITSLQHEREIDRQRLLSALGGSSSLANGSEADMDGVITAVETRLLHVPDRRPSESIDSGIPDSDFVEELHEELNSLKLKSIGLENRHQHLTQEITSLNTQLKNSTRIIEENKKKREEYKAQVKRCLKDLQFQSLAKNKTDQTETMGSLVDNTCSRLVEFDNFLQELHKILSRDPKSEDLLSSTTHLVDSCFSHDTCQIVPIKEKVLTGARFKRRRDAQTKETVRRHTENLT